MHRCNGDAPAHQEGDLMSMTARILAAVEERREELIAQVQALVRIQSETGQEGGAQAFMAGLLHHLDFEVEEVVTDRALVQDHPEFVPNPWPYDGRPNVIGRIRGEGGGRSLILNGHTDVVSPAPLEAWTVDPWGAEIQEGRLYGRGAWDMKSGLLAAVYAARALQDAGIRLQGDLAIHAVIEEEAGGGGGTLALLAAGHRADGMICVEPHWAAVVAHPGILSARIRVQGRSAHAGRAHTGVNAIQKLNRICEALFALDADRARRCQYPLFQERWGRSCHLNIGTYRAGDWASTVPGSAEIELRLSFVPGESMAAVKAEVEAAVHGACAGDPWLAEHPPQIEWWGWRAQPWVQDAGDPLVAHLQAAAAGVGRPAPVEGKTAGLDCRFAAYFGMAALSFGPTGANIHGADEWVSVASIVETCKVLALTAATYCGAVG
jgi:acetylornithine deacetylase